MIKAVIFASNVFGNGKKSYDEFVREFRLSKNDFDKINRKYFLPAKRGEFSKDELLSSLALELNTTKKHVLENAKTCGALLEIDKDVMKLVKRLRREYKVVGICNTTSLFASFEKEKKSYSNFDTSILSYKIKTIHPEKKFYDKIIEKLKLYPEECLYVDRKKELVEPAKKLGMKTILYKDISQISEVLELK